MTEKSLEFLLESWGAAGGPNVYRKGVPSCGTSNTESCLPNFVGRARHCHRLTADLSRHRGFTLVMLYWSFIVPHDVW